MFTGPYTVVREIDPYVVVIRKSLRSKTFTVHRDKLKLVQQSADFSDFSGNLSKTSWASVNHEVTEMEVEAETLLQRPRRHVKPPRRYDDSYCRRVFMFDSMRAPPACDVCQRCFRDKADLQRHKASAVHRAKSSGMSTPPRSRQGLATAEVCHRRKRCTAMDYWNRRRVRTTSTGITQPTRNVDIVPSRQPLTVDVLRDVRVRLIRWTDPATSIEPVEHYDEGERHASQTEPSTRIEAREPIVQISDESPDVLSPLSAGARSMIDRMFNSSTPIDDQPMLECGSTVMSEIKSDFEGNCHQSRCSSSTTCCLPRSTEEFTCTRADRSLPIESRAPPPVSSSEPPRIVDMSKNSNFSCHDDSDTESDYCMNRYYSPTTSNLPQPPVRPPHVRPKESSAARASS